jgi:hypothetical protein
MMATRELDVSWKMLGLTPTTYSPGSFSCYSNKCFLLMISQTFWDLLIWRNVGATLAAHRHTLPV